MADSTLVKSAHIAATLIAAAASGGIISISVITIPAIAHPSRHAKDDTREQRPGSAVSHVAQQWLFTYNTGKIIFPSMAATSSLLYAYVAYAVRRALPRGPRLSNLYLVAAGLVVMIAPITATLILPVNKKLEPYATRDDKLLVEGGLKEEPTIALNSEAQLERERQDREFPALLKKWARLNVIRGLFPAMGAVLGATVAFGFF